MPDYALLLLREIEGSPYWPLKREDDILRTLELYAAIRENDASVLKPLWWEHEHETDGPSREYLVDGLGGRIPEVWGDLLFGEEPTFEAAKSGDKELMDELVDINDLTSELRWAEELCSSEGEVWYRYVAMPELEHCIIEWHSRLNVIPKFIGRHLVACAFVSVLEPVDRGDGQRDQNTESKEWVYVEVHGRGLSYNRLYHHTKGQKLGQTRSLGEHPETAELRPVWEHGLPMLAGRVPNRHGRNRQLGVSDYKRIASLLLALNEITNIGQENARLTAKKKAVIPQRFLTEQGQLPRGVEIIIATEVDQDPDKIKNDFALIEWEFDAQALILYKEDLVDTIITRARVAPQMIGRHTESAQTGPGYRARLVDTELAALGKGRFWDDAVPVVLQRAAQVESLARSKGGLGKSWAGKDEKQIMKRNTALPEDPEARSRRLVTEANANVRSRRTTVEENNPEWGPDRVNEEMKRLKEEAEERAALGELSPPDGKGPMTARSDGQQGVPDPAGGILRQTGRPRPTTVPDPARRTR